jgi:uncharacterized protein
MKIILVTNCFISCIGKKSPYRNVFDGFLKGKFDLCVTTDILLEYEEIFLEKWGQDVTTNLLARIMIADNVLLQNNYFKFNLVTKDADDNKFVDTYISSNADYLITNDRDILNLKETKFPRVNVITLQEFSQLLLLNG